MRSCISSLSVDGSSPLLRSTIAESFACSRWTNSCTRPTGTVAAFSARSQKSAMNSPTIMPATTVSATEFPPRRLKPCMSQQAASPAANSPFSVGLSPVGVVRTPPIV